MAWTKSEKPSLSPDGIRSKAGAPKHLLGISGALDLDGAGHGLNLIKIVGCERDGERPQIFIQAVERPRTKQRNDPWLLSEQPGKSDLRRGCSMAHPYGTDKIDQGLVCFAGFRRETGNRIAEVGGIEGVVSSILPVRKPFPSGL